MDQSHSVAFPVKQKKPTIKRYQSVIGSEEKASNLAIALTGIISEQIPKIIVFRRVDKAYEIRFETYNLPTNIKEIKEYFGFDNIGVLDRNSNIIPPCTHVFEGQYVVVRDK